MPLCDPDYETYSIAELRDALRTIDERKYPDRAQRLKGLLVSKEAELALTSQDELIEKKSIFKQFCEEANAVFDVIEVLRWILMLVLLGFLSIRGLLSYIGS